MAQYTINLNDRTAFGRGFVAMLQSIPQITITKNVVAKASKARKPAAVQETHIPNEETIQAIEEARAGKVTHFKSADDLIAYMNTL